MNLEEIIKKFPMFEFKEHMVDEKTFAPILTFAYNDIEFKYKVKSMVNYNEEVYDFLSDKLSEIRDDKINKIIP